MSIYLSVKIEATGQRQQQQQQQQQQQNNNNKNRNNNFKSVFIDFFILQSVRLIKENLD